MFAIMIIGDNMYSENDVKSLKERINELEDRVEELEKAEHKRKVGKVINLIIKLVILVVTVIVTIKMYQTLNEKVIKPYKEMINSLNNKYTEITDSDAFKNINDLLNSDIFNNGENITNQDWSKIFGQ